MTGASLFIDTLAALGIREIYTLVGDHLNEVLSEAGKRGFDIVDFRHESGVVHAADAVGRLRRKPVVTLVTGGPGHTNSLTGLATAYQACSPVIAVSGAPSTALGGRQVFQVIDQVPMAAPVCKWAATPASAGQIPYYLGRAWQEATTGRMGPVHLTIPVNLFESAVTGPVLPFQPPSAPAEAAPSAAEIERAMALLRSARHPIVIAGSGVWWSDAGAELKEFLRRTSLPLYTVTMARGVVPDSHRLCFGYADGALNKAVHRAFPQADAVLLLGKRLDYRLALGGQRLFSPSVKFIQIDIHGPELGNARPIEAGIHANLKSALRMMNEAAGKKPWPANAAWLRTLRKYRSEWSAELASLAQDRSAPIHPAAFFAELGKALPPNILYAWDGGDFIHWGRATLPAERAGTWLRLGPLGTIGSALPNSIALQREFPSEPVVMITGDGSLGFYLAELDTLVRHNLPVVVIVGNDAGWGLERELQGELQGTTVACELRRSRYDLIMQGFGGRGENIEKLAQVGPAVRRAFASRRPYLLNVNVRGARSPFTQWQIGGKKT
ncbi:MAG: thiamine pyrophosphate-binding protein [Bryobacterales bacterium]|nr:thiamine pyrophosphate-binding protein [Bryobacterales bacterium]